MAVCNLELRGIKQLLATNSEGISYLRLRRKTSNIPRSSCLPELCFDLCHQCSSSQFRGKKKKSSFSSLRVSHARLPSVSKQRNNLGAAWVAQDGGKKEKKRHQWSWVVLSVLQDVYNFPLTHTCLRHCSNMKTAQ